jgi:hypothetical protein
MRKILLTTIILTGINFNEFTSLNLKAKEPLGKPICTDWMPYKEVGPESKLFLKVCKDNYIPTSRGASIKIKNENDSKVTLTYVIKFNNGEEQAGRTTVKPNSETEYGCSCWNCDDRVSGIKSWAFEKIIY